MSTIFFEKKRFLYLAGCQVLSAFLLLVLLYAAYAGRAIKVLHDKAFYFVVSTHTNMEVSAQVARLDGGAGYFLDREGQAYVVWSVYLSEADGQAVQAALADKTQLLTIRLPHLYFKTRTEKSKRYLVEGALQSLYGCIEVLSETVARLDKGLPQGACRRLLATLQRQVAYLEGAYRESYTQFAQLCGWVGEHLQEIEKKTIFSKDLRYLLCGFCEGYIDLTMEFSL